MTTTQVVKWSVTVNSNNPIQDYVHPDDQTQPTFEIYILLLYSWTIILLSIPYNLLFYNFPFSASCD